MRRAPRLLVYSGSVAAVLGLGRYHARYIGHYDLTASARFAWSFAYAGLLCVAAYGTGIPDLPSRRRSQLLTAVSATAAAAGGVSLVQLAMGSALLPRFVVFGAALLLVPWYAACAALAHGRRERAGDRDRVVVVGDRGEAAALRDELAPSSERPALLVGHLTVDEARPRPPWSRPLVELVLDRRATLVVLARDAQADEAVVAEAAALHEAGIRVRTLTLFYEQWLGKLPIGELERVSLLFDIGELHHARYGRVKRLLDVALASVGAVVLALVVPVVVVGNLLGNRGPLLYRQVRIGKNGRPFRINKFRTMRPDAGVPSTWTTHDDPRVTPFGRLLRRTHLDELPQVMNVLAGELSFVGPRPEQPHYVRELAQKIPYYDLRHLVRPGLTGWAQVKYPYGADEADALEKLQYEFFYMRHQGLALDARVAGRTLRAVLRGAGR